MANPKFAIKIEYHTMDLYMHITGVIPIFRLGCIHEHCIISSGFTPYASEPSLRKT
jgi:hypothetical protein